MKKIYKVIAFAFALVLFASPLLFAGPCAFAAGEQEFNEFILTVFDDPDADAGTNYTCYDVATVTVADDGVVIATYDLGGVPVTYEHTLTGCLIEGASLSTEAAVYVPGDQFSMQVNGNVYLFPAEVAPETSGGLYQDAYTLLQSFIFGADTELTEHMDLTLTLLATFAVLAVVFIPYVLVFLVVKMATGR